MTTSKRLPYYPEIDGFGFPNQWFTTEDEFASFVKLLDNDFPDFVGAMDAFSVIADVLLGDLVGLIYDAARQHAWQADLLQLGIVHDFYFSTDNAGNRKRRGWCGGMAYAAADYWFQNQVAPFGQWYQSTPGLGPVRAHIFQRFLDSLHTDLGRYLEWYRIMNVDAEATTLTRKGIIGSQTLAELPGILSEIDNGRVCPVAIYWGDGRAPWEQHVLLCYGYRYDGPDGPWNRLFVYDSNHPGEARELRFYFDPQSFENTMAYDGVELAGFFRPSYQPAATPPTLALDAGIVVAQSNSQLTVGDDIRAVFVASNRCELEAGSDLAPNFPRLKGPQVGCVIAVGGLTQAPSLPLPQHGLNILSSALAPNVFHPGDQYCGILYASFRAPGRYSLDAAAEFTFPPWLHDGTSTIAPKSTDPTITVRRRIQARIRNSVDHVDLVVAPAAGGARLNPLAESSGAGAHNRVMGGPVQIAPQAPPLHADNGLLEWRPPQGRIVAQSATAHNTTYSDDIGGRTTIVAEGGAARPGVHTVLDIGPGVTKP